MEKPRQKICWKTTILKPASRNLPDVLLCITSGVPRYAPPVSSSPPTLSSNSPAYPAPYSPDTCGPCTPSEKYRACSSGTTSRVTVTVFQAPCGRCRQKSGCSVGGCSRTHATAAADRYARGGRRPWGTGAAPSATRGAI